MKSREAKWGALMRAWRAGDGAAYERCLRDMAHALRPLVQRGLSRAGMSPAETEDVVQEVLIAVHLKQHTWDDTRPIGPWVGAIARYKIVDVLRRRGSRLEVPIDDFTDVLAADDGAPANLETDVKRSLEALPERQRAVVSAIAVDGASIREAAAKLQISEGAVRVALHRGLTTLLKNSGGEQ